MVICFHILTDTHPSVWWAWCSKSCLMALPFVSCVTPGKSIHLCEHVAYLSPAVIVYIYGHCSCYTGQCPAHSRPLMYFLLLPLIIAFFFFLTHSAFLWPNAREVTSVLQRLLKGTQRNGLAKEQNKVQHLYTLLWENSISWEIKTGQYGKMCSPSGSGSGRAWLLPFSGQTAT
jgi:hypothetical protein